MSEPVVFPDREHIVYLNAADRRRLEEWLRTGTGAFFPEEQRPVRVIFEAVSGRGLCVRTQPYRVASE